MPRKARPQRTDLSLPKVTVPGQDYGKQQAQMTAMQSVPMAQGEMAPAQMAAAMPTQQATPQVPTPLQSAELKFLHPSDRPDEPITHGIDIGPGGGSEVLAPPHPMAQAPNASMLQQMAMAPGATADIKQMALIASRMGV